MKYAADTPDGTLPSASDIPLDPDQVLEIVEARMKGFQSVQGEKEEDSRDTWTHPSHREVVIRYNQLSTVGGPGACERPLQFSHVL